MWIISCIPHETFIDIIFMNKFLSYIHTITLCDLSWRSITVHTVNMKIILPENRSEIQIEINYFKYCFFQHFQSHYTLNIVYITVEWRSIPLNHLFLLFVICIKNPIERVVQIVSLHTHNPILVFVNGIQKQSYYNHCVSKGRPTVYK